MMISLKNFALLVALLTFILCVSCTSDKGEELDCDATGPSISLEGSTPSGCQPSGVLTVAATGGEGTVLFSIDEGDFQESGTFEGLSAGTHTVVVMDENGCEASLTEDVASDGSAINASADASNSDCTSPTGSITVTAEGGTSPYAFSLDDGAFGQENIFGDVSAGNHTVTVTDEEGCEATVSVLVSSGVSFANQIKPIIDNNCAVSGCHDGSLGASRNWTVFANVKANAEAIKFRTENRIMPPGDRSITQEQIDLIGCWVDDGALSN